MAQVESTAGMVDVERAARGEWLSWTRMADFERARAARDRRRRRAVRVEADGTRLLDAMSGLFTTQIGYSHGAELGEAAARAARVARLLSRTGRRRTRAALALTERDPRARAAENLTRVFFTSGGSEAVESAWKLVAPALPRARRAAAAQDHRPPRRLPRLHARGALADRHPGRAGAVRAAPRRRPPRREHRPPQLRPRRHGRRVDRRRHAPPRSSARSSPRGPTPSRPSSSSRCRTPGGCLAPPPGYGSRAARDLRPLRRAALVRRGDHGLRPARRVVRLDRLGFDARHDHVREGHDLGLRAARRRALHRRGRRAADRGQGPCTRTATRSAAIRSRARSRSRNLDDHGAARRARNVRELEDTPRPPLDDVAAGSPLVVEARGARLLPRARAASTRASSPRARDAIRRHGVIVRLDDRVQPVPRDLAAADLHARARRRARRGATRGSRRGRGSPRLRCCCTTRRSRATATRFGCCSRISGSRTSGGDGRRRPLEPPGRARRAEPGAARADARARRRPLARRVERDHLVPRPTGPRTSRTTARAGAGAAVAVLRAVRPRAEHRGGAFLADLGRAASATRPSSRRARPAATGRSTRWRRHLTAARSSSATRPRSPTSRCTPTRTSPTRRGSILSRYPAIRAWLDKIAALPGHVAITT